MRKKFIIALVIVAIALVGTISVGVFMSNVETPKYYVAKSDGNIEIRQYEPIIIAEVQISGSRQESIKDGFRILADYIFGNNVANQDIAMTSPVQQQSSFKIAMTAPVQQQSSGDSWNVNFIMPSEYTLDTLPNPVDSNITLKQIPIRQFVVIQFSGRNTDENVYDHEEKLMQYIKNNQMPVIGNPIYAFYNPPWVLPPMRRNEIMIEINTESDDFTTHQ